MPSPEHFDVLVIGAGLSGIGAAYHLQTLRPAPSYAILEGRDAIGGTWDLFRYPGIRSDSDMFTLGYRFRPWRDGKAIADGPSIKAYIEDTAREHGITEKIRFRQRVVRAEWSSADARWTVTAEVGDAKTPVRYTCGFLYTCTGYYDYASGYTPAFAGKERFEGRIVHPQHWPADLDYANKRVVVIGSGATAITLVPAMAEQAAHVVMLQRSPTYIVPLASRDAIAERLQRVLPDRLAYAAARWKNVLRGTAFYEVARRFPDFTRRMIRKNTRRALGPDFDLDRHFTPKYQPWDERVCVAADGDFFRALRHGKASIVTDTIEAFDETGIRLTSGQHLDADVIITATGLNAKLLSGVTALIDGQPVELGTRVSYKGAMYSDVPNYAVALGYTNASWTLKCDLIAEHVVRVLRYMREHGYAVVTPRVRDPHMPMEPLLDLKSGYLRRAESGMPKQGARAPWRLHQNYTKDLLALRYGRLAEPELEFARAPAARAEPARGVA